ncbi:UNVERIFIED_CONTAM: hypothetical protein Scaly_2046400 [Sesamum calycinum]|uniref:DDE Tnp4 domain-containing protein n=1 Tax=Sesamum calycinum TaxID=2727403 RepID=A0AAW2N3F1_9LAMI
MPLDASVNYLNNPEGCLGALDGTFIDVRVLEHEKGRYRTRKGSAADNRILRDAVHRPGGLRVPAEVFGITYVNGIVALEDLRIGTSCST